MNLTIQTPNGQPSKSNSNIQTVELSDLQALDAMHSHGEPEVEEQSDARPRSVEPAILIGLGGLGSQTISRVKRLLQDQGSDHLIEFMAIDTDRAAQAGAEHGTPFADSEFVGLSASRNGLVLENPQAHQKLIERLGFDDPRMLAHLEALHADGIEQAGQCRSYGALSLSANRSLVESALKSALSRINGVHHRFRRQLSSGNRVHYRQKVTAYLAFSSAGGTGSSMPIEVAAMLRSLANSLNLRIVAVMLLPSAVDDVLQGKPEQETRVYANSYGTMLEIDAIQSGFGTRHQLTFGINDADSIRLPAGLFNQVFVASRNLADGRDLQSGQAVIENVALHLTAEVGTELGDSIDGDDDNNATLRGQIVDPDSGKSRGISTLNACALALPVSRLARSSTAQWQHQFLKQRVLGQPTDKGTVTALAQGWLSCPLGEEDVSLIPEDLSAGLGNHAGALRGTELTRNLYRSNRGSRPVYWRNGKFLGMLQRSDQQFRNKLLPDFHSRLATIVTSLQGDLRIALEKRVQAIASEHGWRTAQAFVSHLRDELLAAKTQLEQEMRVSQHQGNQLRESVKQSLRPLGGWWKKAFCRRKVQEKVIRLQQDAMQSTIDNQCQGAALKVFTSLLETLEQHFTNAKSILTAAELRMRRVVEEYKQNRPGQTGSTDSLAEIDVTSKKVDLELFEKHRPSMESVLKRISREQQMSQGKLVRKIVLDDSAFDSFQQLIAKYFDRQYRQLSIVDVVGAQLADPTERAVIEAKMRQARDACQPMWGAAEPGRLGMQFSDALIVGIPTAENPAHRDRVSQTLSAIAEGHANADPRYHGSTSHEISGDKTRIFVVRRVHGACFHYLPEVEKCRQAYDRWYQEGGHSVHVFNQQTIAQMGSLFPAKTADHAEVAFALGIAFSWIAVRGPHWYWNLQKIESDSPHFVCPLVSDWDSLAIQNRRLQPSPTLQSLIDSGRIAYHASDEIRSVTKLGENLASGQFAFVKDCDMVAAIHALFGELRAVSSDQLVADELQSFMETLTNRISRSQRSPESLKRLLECLSQQVGKLRTV
ncbi:Tubulin-like protein [Thalassoglobus neptunius]|uniref:Tubulin-like protein n=1 Tax=Thalassoglobus neptunius TaxID=1938619 RepID=A0A5C5VQH7_9PLAN|nr:tubulin-like doman-containing protein [Thalassoglobus neptunius]TWT40854.1 Tubulin-like protein [Thalassoglobus neptunius]